MYKATHSPIPQVWRNACMWQRPGCAGMPLVQRGRVEQFISSALRRMPLACVVCSSERGRGDSLSHSTIEVLRLAAAELCGACRA